MPNVDVTEKLERLASLLDRGLLTREQFEEQRDLLLDQSRRGSIPPDPAAQRPRRTDVPEEIGAYRILGEIGEGGMGTVYRARHRSVTIAERQHGDVAIKVMHANLARSADFQARFEREANLGLSLDHPGIVKVYDLVLDGGVLALVMELVEGRPLSEVIGNETGPIPWDRARPMFEQLLRVVGYAHSQGVIHRDLKPDNVMVMPDGRMKVLDFGIAKEAGSQATMTGTGMGTADYMAPEQHTDAKSVDGRADIYALGMTLYEMLAGRLPWDSGLDVVGVLQRKVSGSLPPPTAFYPDIPPQIVEVVRRATSGAREERFESVDEILMALGMQPIGAGPVHTSEVRRGDTGGRPPQAPPQHVRTMPPQVHRRAPAEGEQAGRLRRLVARVIDFSPVPPLFLLMVLIVENTYDEEIGFAIFFIGMIVLLCANIVLLIFRGQTIGKLLVGIRIVRNSGERVDPPRILFARSLPLLILTCIPYLGWALLVADYATIFRDDHRCLHDLVADTKVVRR